MELLMKMSIFWFIGIFLGEIPWGIIFSGINDKAAKIGLGIQFIGLFLLISNLVIQIINFLN